MFAERLANMSDTLPDVTVGPGIAERARWDGLPLAMRRNLVAAGEAALGASGRLVIRKSGTEPVIRVMAEGEDEALVARIVNEICEEVKAA